METRSIHTAYAAVYQLLEWKRYKEALQEAEDILKEDPEDPDAYALTGQIYLLQEEYDKALYWSGEAIKREPEHKLGWYVRVCVYYETRQYPAFSEAIEEALRIDPYEAHFYFLKANLLNKNGNFAAPKEQLLPALELRPENPLYLAMLSYIEALLRNFPESARLDKITVALAPESLEAHEAQIFLSRVIAWIIFRPLLFLFLILYVLIHWTTKAIIHVKYSAGAEGDRKLPRLSAAAHTLPAAAREMELGRDEKPQSAISR